MIPANNKPIRIESLSGELDGGDWANVNQIVEIVSNQGVWFTVNTNIDIIRGKVKDIRLDHLQITFSTSMAPSSLMLTMVPNRMALRQALPSRIITFSTSMAPSSFDINGTLFFIISNDNTNGKVELWKSDAWRRALQWLKISNRLFRSSPNNFHYPMLPLRLTEPRTAGTTMVKDIK